MNFEIFEKTLWAAGYGIVACNHYSVDGQRKLYCAIMDREGTRAFRAEGSESSYVFQLLIGVMEAKEATKPVELVETKTRYFKMQEKTDGIHDDVSHWVSYDGENLLVVGHDGETNCSVYTVKEMEKDPEIMEVSKEDI